jgi:hypothetical protein
MTYAVNSPPVAGDDEPGNIADSVKLQEAFEKKVGQYFISEMQSLISETMKAISDDP